MLKLTVAPIKFLRVLEFKMKAMTQKNLQKKNKKHVKQSLKEYNKNVLENIFVISTYCQYFRCPEHTILCVGTSSKKL